MDVLAKKDKTNENLYIYTGEILREFIKGESPTQRFASEMYLSGGLMPEFLVVHMWVKFLVEHYKGKQNLFFDGTPRKLHEAGVLNSAFPFYGINKRWVVNMEISEEEAMRRLRLRRRIDDSEEDIKKRLAWYKTDVLPAIEYYRDNTKYNYMEIDGERPIGEIHDELVKRVGL
jgi:adenylate kinase